MISPVGRAGGVRIAISELIADDALNESECLQWLKENDWMTQDMPELIKREVANLLKKDEGVTGAGD